MRHGRIAVAFAAGFAAACASWRLSGYRPGQTPLPEPSAPRVLTTPAPSAAVEPIPQAPPERLKKALFYSDLGPDSVDVSSYPAQQRYDYAAYARVCSACHSLARSINAPMVSRAWWQFYMMSMRVRGRREGHPLSPSDVKAVLDFLEYDSRVRKVEHEKEFARLTEELKARFDAELAGRLESLQQANPHPLAP